MARKLKREMILSAIGILVGLFCLVIYETDPSVKWCIHLSKATFIGLFGESGRVIRFLKAIEKEEKNSGT
ncbi:hypothetical protein SAMN02910358_01556 [Lachnospiraceae bacterium XBB1006]|nr:hypothetical protein SAMN02910358_01556 [Lachnospiraceae bacterium XBB1006]